MSCWNFYFISSYILPFLSGINRSSEDGRLNSTKTESKTVIDLTLNDKSTLHETTNPNTNYSSSHYLVELRCVILKVGDIDTLNEKFSAEVFVEAKWIDASLSPSEKYNSENHWNPHLYVLNGWCLSYSIKNLGSIWIYFDRIRIKLIHQAKVVQF